MTTLLEDQAKAANQGKPGYNVLGEKVPDMYDTSGNLVTPKPLASGGADATGLSTTKPSLIVTSAPSRTQYNDNVNKMQTALNNTAQGSGSSQFNYVDKTGKMQTVNANNADEALQKITSLGADPHSGVEEVKKPETKTNEDGSSTTSNPDGTTKTDNPDGTSTSTTSDGLNLPTEVKKQYDDVIAASDEVLTQRKADLDAAKQTVANDPAANTALDRISHQYDVLIKAMQDKNKILLGGYQVGQARSGALQFANEMSSNFMSEEMDRANGRISDLITKENDLLLKTSVAYKTGDVKALNAAQTAYEKANTDKLKAIGDLAKATNDHIKTVQAQAKIDAQQAKQQTTDDIRLSTSLATSVADNIIKSGIKDQKQIDAYLQEMAKSAGISNVEVLRSAVVKAQQAQSKADLAATNTKDIIANRGKTKVTKPKTSVDGGYTYTTDDVASYTKLLNEGGKDPSGTQYAPRGEDGFVDPGAYTAALNDWIKNGGTPLGFAKKFPAVGNVNPDSYSTLPQAIQPKASKTPVKKFG